MGFLTDTFKEFQAYPIGEAHKDKVASLETRVSGCGANVEPQPQGAASPGGAGTVHRSHRRDESEYEPNRPGTGLAY